MTFLLTSWIDGGHPWGKLPFADGEVRPMNVTYEKPIGVIIANAHPTFVEATRKSQGKTAN